MTTISSLLKTGLSHNVSTNSTNSTPLPVPNRPSHANIPLIVILSVLIPLIFAGNMLVCVVFIKYQRLRNATNWFLFSLAVSDLAVGLILIPLWITLMLMGFSNVPQRLVVAFSILDITCSVASMANLACVSMERWYGVTYPFRHMKMSPNKAVVMACCSWIYALGTALIFLTQKLWMRTIITVLGVCVPFLIMVASYCGIARKIRQKTLSGTPQSGRECKTIRTLIFVTIIFLVCWFPFVIGSLIVNHCSSCEDYVNRRPVIHVFPKVLHYASSCINPVLYALLSPSFKSAYQQLFCGTQGNGGARFRKNRLSMDPTGTTGIVQIKKFNFSPGFKDERDSPLIAPKLNNNNVAQMNVHRESIV